MTGSVRIAFAAFVLASAAGPASFASARVLPTAPVSARSQIPALQSRLDRRNALIERVGPGAGPWACIPCLETHRLVVYDSEGIDEPRDVSPGGAPSRILSAASYEDGGSVRLLAVSDATLPGEPAPGQVRILYSRDTGTTWKAVALPPDLGVVGFTAPAAADVGGWVARERDAALRLGTSEVPFVLALPAGGPASGGWSLVGIEISGQTRLLASGARPAPVAPLVGSDVTWARFLVVADLVRPGPGGVARGETKTRGLYSVDLSGNVTRLLGLGVLADSLQAWTATDDSTYVQIDEAGGSAAAPFTAPRSFGVARGGSFTELVTAGGEPEARLFGVPSATGKGAWILKRGGGPTVLMSHSAEKGFRTHWSDETRPEIEAIHVGTSGNRLLLQAHRTRQISPHLGRLDSTLAIWEVGQPAPGRWDELFVTENPTKGFVHLDVDAAAGGAPFLFNSGEIYLPGPASEPSGGTGIPLVQDWGVVRASLVQRLVVPAAARTDGRNGSVWRTDLTLRNPGETSLSVAVSLVPNPATTSTSPAASVVLEPGETRLVPDAVKTLFGLESGSGALLLVPPPGRAIDATSRTYSLAAQGTFGMAAGAVDVQCSASGNTRATYAAALLGSGFRTNLLATDASVRGTRLSLSLAPSPGEELPAPLDLDVPVGTQRQQNGLAGAADLPPRTRASLVLTPLRGAVISGLTAIDDSTNDPTWFGPDLHAGTSRTIPALVHADGAGGAAYRSDLFLFNPAGESLSVSLVARDWKSPETTKALTWTLLPGESRVSRDALLTAFGLTGVAQLAFTSGSSYASPEGIRVTSRTYTAAPGGGTYGHPVPPLESFQSASAGETLEILGPVQAPGFRTNLALLDLAGPASPAAPLEVRVEIVAGRGGVVAGFTRPLAPGGGIQINDLFNARGLPQDLGPVLIRVSTSGGSLAAYATTIDNGTNDPTYYPAALATAAE